jgi:hypothetical protein
LVAEEWLAGRAQVKQRTRESDQGPWRNYIEPRWGDRPVASITTADVSNWVGSLPQRGLAASTVPLVPEVSDIVDRWATGRSGSDWLFPAPKGGPMSEANWRRSVGWKGAIIAAGRPNLRVHDLRHTAASLWLGQGADPKVVQRVLGHATASMTMDLYGHLIDANLWTAAARIGSISGARTADDRPTEGGQDVRNER